AIVAVVAPNNFFYRIGEAGGLDHGGRENQRAGAAAAGGLDCASSRLTCKSRQCLMPAPKTAASAASTIQIRSRDVRENMDARRRQILIRAPLRPEAGFVKPAWAGQSMVGEQPGTGRSRPSRIVNLGSGTQPHPCGK